MGTSTQIFRTSTKSPLYNGHRYQLFIPVPFCGFYPEMADFSISHSLFFNKPPQIHPTLKPTMEFSQNNSKSGLAPIKTPFTQVRAFPQNQNHKKGKLGFCFLTLCDTPIFGVNFIPFFFKTVPMNSDPNSAQHYTLSQGQTCGQCAHTTGSVTRIGCVVACTAPTLCCTCWAPCVVRQGRSIATRLASPALKPCRDP